MTARFVSVELLDGSIGTRNTDRGYPFALVEDRTENTRRGLERAEEALAALGGPPTAEETAERAALFAEYERKKVESDELRARLIAEGLRFSAAYDRGYQESGCAAAWEAVQAHRATRAAEAVRERDRWRNTKPHAVVSWHGRLDLAQKAEAAERGKRWNAGKVYAIRETWPSDRKGARLEAAP